MKRREDSADAKSFGADSEGVDSASAERPLEDWLHRPYTRATLVVMGAFTLITIVIGAYVCLTIDPHVTIPVNPSGNRRWNLPTWGIFIPTVGAVVINGKTANAFRFEFAPTRRAFFLNLVFILPLNIVFVGGQIILATVFYDAAGQY